MKPKLLIRIGLILTIQAPAILLAQTDEGDSTPEISISIEEGKVKIAVNLNEPFRWENTRYESIKKFPQPWIGSPDTPHEIWFEEKGDMTWRQTDMMFMGNYTELDEYEVEVGVIGYLVEIIGVFNPETNLLNFDTLDYDPLFIVPKLIVEESKDMKKWSKVKLSAPLPNEYQWPQELSIEMEAELKESTFYRVKIVG
ncbi:MAG: hypothetical protein QF749_04070 [Verrucomicrobiota bacterium]|jgi:hypothetical protein|nr:hypothetical protein [Verrucomicrobiota bacterium]MDP7177449.1 hypothetical protein [Verrucomicrobiota bacterium]MDP7291160.1 hypothetical protein [Verrucomicrobiota bacterium]MDP7441330.1 hypothetical protein [Verrucomicrobiota bacterium]